MEGENVFWLLVRITLLILYSCSFNKSHTVKHYIILNQNYKKPYLLSLNHITWFILEAT